MLLAESLYSSQLTFSISGVLWTSPVMWLQIILATAIVTIPLYVWKTVMALYIEPQFLAVD